MSTELTSELEKVGEETIRTHLAKAGYKCDDLHGAELIAFGSRVKPVMDAVRAAREAKSDKPPPVTKRRFTPPVPDEEGAFLSKSLPDEEPKAGLNYELAATDPEVLASGNGFEILTKAPPNVGAAVLGIPAATVKDLQQLSDQVFLTATVLARGGNEAYQHRSFGDIARSLKSYNLFLRECQVSPALAQAQRKALDTAESGAGSDWIPTGFSADLKRRVELELVCGRLFDSIPMPTSPYKMPVDGAPPTAYLAGESTADSSSSLTASDAATASVTFTAVKLATRVLFSDELSEDSVVPVLPWVESRIVRSLSEAIEDALLNGDTDASHFDVARGTVAATSHLRSFDGLRHFWQDQSSKAEQSLATLSVANLLLVRAKMGKYGVNPSEGAWITGPYGFMKLIGLDECMTLDKIGSRATIIAGQQASLLGSPLIVSEKFPESLNTAGIWDGSTTTKTAVLYAHTGAALRGSRSSNLESDRIVETQQTQVVGVNRVDFQAAYTTSSENIVGVGYNLAKT